MDRKAARNRILENMFDFRIIRRTTLAQLLDLVEDFTSEVPQYRLICNMDPEAAVVAYTGMQREV